MKINNIILVPRTCIILSSSFVSHDYIFFCMCHLGSFPITMYISHTIKTNNQRGEGLLRSQTQNGQLVQALIFLEFLL